ncbi:MAG: PVC-type heme-binding CxxCH protein [Balneolaceae bacterium]
MNKFKQTLFSYFGGVLAMVFLIVSACASADTTTSQETADNTQMNEAPAEQEANRLHVLFLGDGGHHNPSGRVEQLIPYFAERGIQLTYTERQADLNPATLGKYDVFMMYGNRSGLEKDQELALVNYVNNGGGVVAIHSASASFNDSDAFVNLVGGAFKAHAGGTFSVEHVRPNHPVKQGVPRFESWDETYVHSRLNSDIEVLSVRVEGDHREPWTWVREQGDGRVFYTAWGHDNRTWSNDGFKKLIENGTRWVAGDWALDADFSLPELTYSDGLIPYYPAGEPWSTTGDPITEVQDPLSPEESLQHIYHDPGFRVELFASEPDVINPIDMTWDEKGRLWVVETVDYPNDFAPDRIGNDRIKVLEDTNGDGRADNVTVFAEGLNIPTSLTLWNGGVIVAHAPDYIYLKDTTGDGKADHREVLFTGWGTFDTHAGPSNLHYGFDNQIWGAVGYSAFEGEVGGENVRFSSGFYRFTPDGSRLEQMARTSNNTWGFGFNEEGIVFGSTANNDIPVYHAVPHRFYSGLRGVNNSPVNRRIAEDNSIYPITDNVRQVDQWGRYTAAAGAHIYGARNFPKEYWNRIAFIAEPTGHLLGRFILEPDGSSYTADNTRNMLASRDAWFSPIQSKVGPDGALWVIDWYNLIIQHNPTPGGWERGEGNAYINEHRDTEHARIYRVVYEGEEDQYQAFDLDGATPTELVRALTHSNMFWRLTAQRLLVERGETDVLPALYELVRNEDVDEIGLNPGALHALWTMHGLGALDGSNRQAVDVAYGAMHHTVPSVQRAALMTIPRNRESLDKLISGGFLPTPMPSDYPGYALPAISHMPSHSQVRLAALLAVAEMPSSERAGIGIAELFTVPQIVNDRWIRDAVTAAGAQHAESFLQNALDKRLPGNVDSTRIENVQYVVERVARHYALGNPSGSQVSDMLLKLENAHETIGEALISGFASADSPSFNSNQRTELGRLRGLLQDSLKEHLDELADEWETADLFGSR